MKNLKIFLFDIFFPVNCLSCKKEGDWLCASCYKEIRINNWDCSSLKNQLDYLDGYFAATDYKAPHLEELIHLYKYKFIVDAAKILGQLLIDFFNQSKNPGFLDLIIPVPLTRKRRAWRGYNQAEILADILSSEILRPVDRRSLKRISQADPQVGLNAKKRLANIKDNFFVDNPSAVKGRNILLIDDVMTTGATLNECARVLKIAGAKKVFGLIVCEISCDVLINSHQ